MLCFECSMQQEPKVRSFCLLAIPLSTVTSNPYSTQASEVYQCMLSYSLIHFRTADFIIYSRMLFVLSSIYAFTFSKPIRGHFKDHWVLQSERELLVLAACSPCTTPRFAPIDIGRCYCCSEHASFQKYSRVSQGHPFRLFHPLISQPTMSLASEVTKHLLCSHFVCTDCNSEMSCRWI
jgi:hypothetical protein